MGYKSRSPQRTTPRTIDSIHHYVGTLIRRRDRISSRNGDDLYRLRSLEFIKTKTDAIVDAFPWKVADEHLRLVSDVALRESVTLLADELLADLQNRKLTYSEYCHLLHFDAQVRQRCVELVETFAEIVVLEKERTAPEANKRLAFLRRVALVMVYLEEEAVYQTLCIGTDYGSGPMRAAEILVANIADMSISTVQAAGRSRLPAGF